MAKSAWKKPRKQNNLETREYQYYIFCEGTETEPTYFKGFKKAIEQNPIYKDMVLIEIQPCQAETMRVLGKAQKYIEENKITKGQIWCVYDKDDFPEKDFNQVVQATKNLNKKNEEENKDIQYHAAWSNQCFEIWFLLHFSYYTSNTDRKKYKSALDEIFKKIGLEKYEKNIKNTFEILTQHGNPKNAIGNAKKLIEAGTGKTPSEISPGTMVHELVEELAKYLPEEIKNKYTS